MSILTTECVGGIEFHIRIERIYGEHCISEPRFRSRASAFAKDVGPGWRYEWSIESFHIPACWESDDLIKKDHRVTVDDISAAVWLSHGTVHAIIVAPLKFLKVWTQWVTTAWHQYKGPIACPCLCNCCGVATTVWTTFCQQLSPMMKVGATILSWNRNGKVENGRTHIALQEKRSRTCTLILARQCFSSSLIPRFRSSLISWCVELEAIFSRIWKCY